MGKDQRQAFQTRQRKEIKERTRATIRLKTTKDDVIKGGMIGYIHVPLVTDRVEITNSPPIPPIRCMLRERERERER